MHMHLTYENWLKKLYEIKPIDNRNGSQYLFFKDKDYPRLKVMFRSIKNEEQILIKQKRASLHKDFVDTKLEEWKKMFELKDFQLSSRDEVLQNEIFEIKKYFFSDFDSDKKDIIFKIGNDMYGNSYLNEISAVISELRRGIETNTEYILSPINIFKNSKFVVAEAIVKYLKWLESMIIHEDINSIHDNATNHENIKCVDVVIYLNELGVIEHIMKNAPKGLSVNGIATLLAKITKNNPKVLEPYLRSLLSAERGMKNDPYNNKKNVNKIKSELVGLGFK